LFVEERKARRKVVKFPPFSFPCCPYSSFFLIRRATGDKKKCFFCLPTNRLPERNLYRPPAACRFITCRPYIIYIIYTYIYNIHIIEENPQKTHPLAVPYPPPKTETESRKKIKKIQKIFKIYFLALFKNKTNLYPFPLSNSLTKPEISGFCVNVDLIKKLYNYIVSNKKTYSVI